MSVIKYIKEKIFSQQSGLSLGVSIILALGTYLLTNEVDAQTVYITVFTFVISYFLTFIVTELYEYTMILREHKKYIGFFEEFEKEGIEKYYPRYQLIELGKSLNSSTRLSIISIYTSKTLIQNFSEFRNFLSKTNNVLEIVVLEPDLQSHEYQYLTNKFGYAQDKIKTSVEELVRELRSIKASLGVNSATVRIYYSKLVPQYSGLIFDDHLYVTFYKNSPGREDVPSFKVVSKNDSTFYNFIVNDYRSLVNDGGFVRKEEL